MKIKYNKLSSARFSIVCLPPKIDVENEWMNFECKIFLVYFRRFDLKAKASNKFKVKFVRIDK